MASRGLFGGQAPEYKLEANPGAGQDGYFLAFDSATGGAAFTGNPVVPTLAVSSGAAVTITETGGAGVISTVFGQCYQQALPGGAFLLDVDLIGDISSANLTGGTTELKMTLPSDLASDNSLTQAVGVAYVTDTAGPHVCIVRVGDGSNKLIMTRQSGTFAAGAFTFQSIHISYVHP